MNITHTGSGAYVFSAARQEFDTYCITKEQAKSAVLNALNLPFLPHNTVIELYEGGDELVIFAHSPTSFYAFENFEDVIAACENCTAESSALYCYDGEYILSVSLPDGILDEFAHRIDAPNSFDAYLNEYGKLLIAFDAVNFVKNTF